MVLILCDSGVTSRSLGLTDFSPLRYFLKSPIAWKLSEETAEAGLKSLFHNGFICPVTDYSEARTWSTLH